MRSPSGSAPGSIRGRAPVAMSTASAVISRPPTAIVRGPASRPAPETTSTPSAASRIATSADCARARAFTRPYRRGASTVPRAGGRALAAADPDAEVGRAVQRRHRARGLDQRLGGHAVGQHAGAAEPVGVGHDDLGAELRGDQGGLIPAGPPSDDRDTRGGWLTMPHSGASRARPGAGRGLDQGDHDHQQRGDHQRGDGQPVPAGRPPAAATPAARSRAARCSSARRCARRPSWSWPTEPRPAAGCRTPTAVRPPGAARRARASALSLLRRGECNAQAYSQPALLLAVLRRRTAPGASRPGPLSARRPRAPGDRAAGS